MTVTLTYDLDDVTRTRDFDAVSVNFVDVKFHRRVNKFLNGGYGHAGMGYRYVVRVDLFPVGADKEAVYFLYGFMLGTNRQITYAYEYGSPETRNIVPIGNSLDFDFLDKTYISNVTTLLLEETELRTITDTGSTRILKPTFTPGTNTIAGETLTRSVDLVNDNDIELTKHDLDFIGGEIDSISYRFVRRFKVDFGHIRDQATLTWLIEYVLWQNTQIDTTLIDEFNGHVYTTIFEGQAFSFNLEDGVEKAPTLEISLIENVGRAVVEAYVAPSSAEFIVDDDTTDSKTVRSQP